MKVNLHSDANLIEQKDQQKWTLLPSFLLTIPFLTRKEIPRMNDLLKYLHLVNISRKK